jgi:hypothetical protein
VLVGTLTAPRISYVHHRSHGVRERAADVDANAYFHTGTFQSVFTAHGRRRNGSHAQLQTFLTESSEIQIAVMMVPIMHTIH